MIIIGKLLCNERFNRRTNYVTTNEAPSWIFIDVVAKRYSVNVQEPDPYTWLWPIQFPVGFILRINHIWNSHPLICILGYLKIVVRWNRCCWSLHWQTSDRILKIIYILRFLFVLAFLNVQFDNFIHPS